MIIDLTCSLVREIALLDSVVCLKAIWQLHQAVGIELVLDSSMITQSAVLVIRNFQIFLLICSPVRRKGPIHARNYLIVATSHRRRPLARA